MKKNYREEKTMKKSQKILIKRRLKHIILILVLNNLLICEVPLIFQNRAPLTTKEIIATNVIDTEVKDKDYQNVKASNGSYFPYKRDNPAIVIDPQTGLIYLFAGSDGGNLFSDLWCYNQTSNVWIFISTITPLGEIFGHSFCFDNDRNRMVIFGGYHGVPINDIWFYYPANNSWYNPNPPSSPRPPSGFYGSMCYNKYLNAYIVAGGGSGNLEPYINKSYAYFPDNNTWQVIGDLPEGRGYPQMVYDANEQQAMLFGGDISGKLSGDVYGDAQKNTLFHLNNENKEWNTVSVSTPPVAMPYFMVYDSISKKPTIYNTEYYAYTSNFYTLNTSTSTWTKVEPLNKPITARPMGLVYCESNNQFLFFGTVNNGTDNIVNIWQYRYVNNSWISLNPMGSSTPIYTTTSSTSTITTNTDTTNTGTNTNIPFTSDSPWNLPIIIGGIATIVLVSIGVVLKKKKKKGKPQLENVISDSKEITPEQEKIMLEKFEAILKMSQKVKIKNVAENLNVSDKILFERLIKWNKTIPFKIDNEMIVVENLTEFIGALDAQFDDWKEKEQTKEGKIEHI
jgi:N-acetylneuraminic acid mutarotase